jgi:endonuclease YncB( thermonuclease family)
MHRLLILVASVVHLCSPASALTAEFPVCGSPKRVTCVVDGDTVWFRGTKYRLEDIDAPEKGSLAECPREALQAAEATERLAEILSEHDFTIETQGQKDKHRRTLARFMIGGKSAGEMLVTEGLARRWRGHTEDWCGTEAVLACSQDAEAWRPRHDDKLPTAPGFVTGEFRCFKIYDPENQAYERVCAWTDG